MDSSLHLFGTDPYDFAYKLQQEIYQKTRITCAIGIGASPLMAKLCLDLSAKKHPNRISRWTYEDIQTKLWPTRPLSKFYGISTNTEQKLNRKGIHTIGDLAQYPLKYLKQTFGPVIGEELHLHSWGIDFSRIREKHVPKSSSITKNQVLLRDYNIQEIPIVLLEHIEEVCYRLRREKKYAQTIHFSVGYSREYGGGIKKAHTLNRATNLTMDIYNVCTYFLYERHTGEPIRSISLSLTNLIHEGEEQISLFDNIIQREKEMRLTKVMDEIRTRFGKNSILRGISYTSVATARYRNTLLGGHKS